METNPTTPPEEPQVPKFRGLYRYVKISVKSLNLIIIACIAVILVVFALEMRNPGFTVTFDSKGGSDVPAQNYMWGQTIDAPQIGRASCRERVCLSV